MEITDAKVIAERLSKVRDIMKTECVDIYVVVTGDYHISEYAGCLLYTSPSPRD